jgi:histidyl-tRNA synthetase
MSNLISKKIRGFRDILPTESKKFLHIENIIHRIAPLFNVQQIRLPALESIDLFKRSIGEASDIVTKEMYSFEDRNNDILCMIPEGTASCVRLALENNLIYDRGPKKQRLYYIAPMFRHERPQKGRYRQFTQFGAEFFGDTSYTNDIDLILLITNIFEKLNLLDIKLSINTIGTAVDRKKYSQELATYFHSCSEELSDAQHDTLSKNPMRLLDSKDTKLKSIIASAPLITDFLNKESQANFNTIKERLDRLKIPFIHDPKLVRGLDYYNDLVFEWKTNKLGSQDAVCAGGRYDNLSETIGDKSVPSVGFAMGLDRIVELLDYESNELIIGLAVINNSNDESYKILTSLRNIDFTFNLIQMDDSKSLSKQIKQADKSNCDILIIVGNDEISNNTFTVKYLKCDKEDQIMPFEKLIDLIAGYKK